MQFRTIFLREIIDTPIRKTLLGSTDEVVFYESIFKDGDKLYRTFYRIGKEGISNEEPYEYENEFVECEEVEEIKTKVIGYVAVGKDE